MMKVENGVEISVFKKDYGREVYTDTLEEAVEYLQSKKLDFIADALIEGMKGLRSYKEICITEAKTGYVLEAGYCLDGSFSYTQCYSAQ